MKLFILTFNNGTEVVQHWTSLASLAIAMDNSKYLVRAIEEVPAEATLEFKFFTQLSEKEKEALKTETISL